MPKWWDPAPPHVVTAIPWLGPDVILYLNRLLEPEWSVCEHGSGGSTVWFAERVRRVVSVESAGDWLDVVENSVPRNVELIYSNEPEPPGKVRRKSFDLLLIDGVPLEHRNTWLDTAEKIVRPGGIVVLDNANRPELAAARERLQARAEVLAYFDENSESAGTKYLTTEFFKLPETVKGGGHARREQSP